MKVLKKIWEIICILGIVWGGATAIIVYYVQYRIYAIDSRGIFRPDTGTIFMLTIMTMVYVFLKNSLHFGNGEQIGLLTFLKPADNQPNSMSAKKQKAQNPDIPDELLSDRAEGVILGNYKNKYVRYIIKSGHIMHTLITGSVGAGKSTILKSTIIAYLGEKKCTTKNGKTGYKKPDVAMFVVDVKPELYEDTTNYKCPYTRCINPEDRNSFGWDVYYAIDDDTSEDQVVEQLDIIANALIQEQKNSKNSFFSDSGKNIFVGILLYTIKKGMSFMEGLEYLMSDSLDNILKEVIEKSGDKPNYHRVKSLLRPYMGKEENEGMQNIDLTIRQNLKPFLSDSFKWLLGDNPKKCSPLDLEKRISIYLCLKDSKLGSYSILMRLITMQLVKHGTERDPKAHALIYVLDECPRLGTTILRELTDFMALSRGFNVACILLAQSINQFHTKLSREETETLMEICRIIGVLSCKSREQADILAGWAGTYLEKKTSYSHKSQKDINSFNVSFDEKPILNASDLMHLVNKKEILLFIDGYFYKASAEKARYYNIPALNKMAERNIRINSKKQKTERR